jgi:hypothetical protein
MMRCSIRFWTSDLASAGAHLFAEGRKSNNFACDQAISNSESPKAHAAPPEPMFHVEHWGCSQIRLWVSLFRQGSCSWFRPGAVTRLMGE